MSQRSKPGFVDGVSGGTEVRPIPGAKTVREEDARSADGERRGFGGVTLEFGNGAEELAERLPTKREDCFPY